MLEAGENGQLCVFIRLPCERGRDEIAIIVEIIGLCASFANHARQAISKLITFSDRTPKIKISAIGVIAASLNTDLTEFFKSRAFADHIDQATGIALTKHHRSRPAHHFDTLKHIGIKGRSTCGTHKAKTV